jgi:hypothetical protein
MASGWTGGTAWAVPVERHSGNRSHESRYLGAIFPLSSRLESNAVRGCVSR